jgi:chaperonin GroEL
LIKKKMNKQIVFNQEAKTSLLKGVTKLSDAVTCTLGPNGRNVIIENQGGNPTSTKDGVTVAKSISLKDPIENVGAQILKQAAIKTAELAGDGTTTTTLLAYEMVKYGFEAIKAGSNAVEVKRGIEKASKEIIAELKTISQDISSEDQIHQVAVISANGDEEMGTLISEAMNKVGVDGVVTVEESRIGETSLEIVEGIQFDKGYKSMYFVTNNDTMTATLDKPQVLLYNGKLTQVKELLPLLEGCSQAQKSLLIIAEDIDGEALSALIVNKMRGILKVAAVKAPDFGDRRLHILEDIATVTGGTVVTPEKGMKLEKFNTEWLGSARLVNVAKETTTIVDGKGDVDKIEQRIDDLKSQIDKAQSFFEIEKLQERLAKLTGGVAVISIGAATEVEMKEKKDRLDDALHATKAALQEGIIVGGGSALLHARRKLNTEYETTDLELGRQIVRKACLAPFVKILTNAGYEETDTWDLVNNISRSESTDGYDLKSKSVVNLIDKGIIDPTKVTRLALENAVSVAGTILITEAIVYEEPEKDKQNSPMDMGMYE